MMDEIQEVELGSIGKVQTGPFGSQLLNEQYVTGGTPIITVEHIKDFRISYQPFPSVTDADKKRLSRYVMKAGDIVFSRVGSVDLVVSWSQPMKMDGSFPAGCFAFDQIRAR